MEMKARKKHAHGPHDANSWMYRAPCGRLVSYHAMALWPEVTCGTCLRARRYITQGSSYIKPEVIMQREFIREARAALQSVDYDTLVGTGLSGSLAIPLLARFLRKRWMIIRKPQDGSHSGTHEGQLGRRWLFVDDFISTGATRKRVMNGVRKMSQSSSWKTTYVGTYTYNRDGYQPATPDQIKEGSTT